MRYLDFEKLSADEFVLNVQNGEYGGLYCVINDEYEDFAAWAGAEPLEKWDLLDLAWDNAICYNDERIVIDGYDCIVDDVFLNALVTLKIERVALDEDLNASDYPDYLDHELLERAMLNDCTLQSDDFTAIACNNNNTIFVAASSIKS